MIDPRLEQCCRFPVMERKSSLNEAELVARNSDRMCPMPTLEKCCGDAIHCYHNPHGEGYIPWNERVKHNIETKHGVDCDQKCKGKK